MLRNDGSGLRRTAGGVYLGVLLRENVSRDEYKFIQAAIKRHRPSVAPVYIRGVPPSATAADVNDALKTKFGSWGYRLRLQQAPTAWMLRLPDHEQTQHGKVFFTSLKVRIAAVAHGSLAVAGGIMAIDDAPTEGLHCTVDGAALGDIEVPDNGEGGEWCPDDFICPITLEQLKDPVVAADGLTYEREALQEWICKHRADQVVLSPATGAPLAHRELAPNTEIMAKISSVGRLASWLSEPG